MRFRLSNALDLLVLAGEAAWVSAWTVTVGAWVDSTRAPLLDLPGVLALLVPSALLARAAARSSERRHLLAGAIVALGLVVALLPAINSLQLLSLPFGDLRSWSGRLESDNWGRIVLSGAAAALVWRRGLDVGRVGIDLTGVEASFRTGVIAMSSLLAFVGMAGAAAPIASDVLIPPTLVVLVSGLVGMPLARIAEVSARPRHTHAPGLMPGGPWLAMLGAIVSGILVLTLILARLFTFDRIGSVLDAVGRSTDGFFRTVIYILAIPFGLLVQAFVFLGQFLIRPGQERPRTEQPGLDWMSRLQERGETGNISPELLLFLKIALGVALTVILVWILWRAVSRLGRLWIEDDVDEVRDSVWTWPGWVAVWRWMLSRLRPIGARAVAMAAALRPEAPREEHTARGFYRELLRLGAMSGHPRHLPETPTEYEHRLDELIPTGEAEIRTLSAAYVRHRYAPPSTQEPDIPALSSALARLRVLWKAQEGREG